MISVLLSWARVSLPLKRNFFWVSPLSQRFLLSAAR